MHLRAAFSLAFALCSAAPSMAADRSKAAELHVPGTTIIYTATADALAGYDSNPDSLTNGPGSGFEKIEAASTFTSDSEIGFYTFALKTRQYEFQDLAISHRWDLKANLDTAFALSNTQNLKLGGSFLRDFVPLNRADVYKAYADYTIEQPDYHLRFQAKSNTDVNSDDGARNGLNVDIFDVTRGRAYDYSRTEGQAAILLMPQSLFEPYAIVNYAFADYFHETADPIISRTAPEQFAIAGLRIKPDSTFHADLGARVNHRNFDDLDIPKITTWDFDGRMSWRPTSAYEFTALIERVMKETTSSFGLVDDLTTFGLTAYWQVDEQWSLDASAYYDHLVPIGDTFRYDKYSATLGAAYTVNDHTEIFISGLAKLTQELTTKSDYTRFKIDGGVRVGF